MAGPAFAGKIYPQEVAGKIEQQFAQEVRGWVRATGNATSAAKALMATADISAPFIQGAAMFARNPIRWAKATLNSYKALADPNHMARLMEHPRYKELAEQFSQSGGSLLQLQDFLAGLKPGAAATKIPGYGGLLTATGRAYGAFLDLAKLELFDAWRQSAPRAEWPRLAETIENSLFMGRMEQVGLNPHRAIGERLLLVRSFVLSRCGWASGDCIPERCQRQDGASDARKLRCRIGASSGQRVSGDGLGLG